MATLDKRPWRSSGPRPIARLVSATLTSIAGDGRLGIAGYGAPLRTFGSGSPVAVCRAIAAAARVRTRKLGHKLVTARKNEGLARLQALD